jgi:hypothetical protein
MSPPILIVCIDHCAGCFTHVPHEAKDVIYSSYVINPQQEEAWG